MLTEKKVGAKVDDSAGRWSKRRKKIETLQVRFVRAVVGGEYGGVGEVVERRIDCYCGFRKIR